MRHLETDAWACKGRMFRHVKDGCTSKYMCGSPEVSLACLLASLAKCSQAVKCTAWENDDSVGIRQAKYACLNRMLNATKKLLSFFLFDRSVVGFGEGR